MSEGLHVSFSPSSERNGHALLHIIGNHLRLDELLFMRQSIEKWLCLRDNHGWMFMSMYILSLSRFNFHGGRRRSS